MITVAELLRQTMRSYDKGARDALINVANIIETLPGLTAAEIVTLLRAAADIIGKSRE